MSLALDGADPKKPTQFGKYELLKKLAMGGMAEIFLARSASLGGITRRCVIKRILPEYSSDPDFVNMFIDEARITVELEHRNIVRLFDFGQIAGTYYMAMEYVDGFDLVDVLRTNAHGGTRLPTPIATFIARELCLGLDHAHTKTDYRGKSLGIVHRDVSPHNIFLSRLGEVKIGDFGIASAQNKMSQTQVGTIKGKFAYMSPEQAQAVQVDSRADIWAAGVTLYELLTCTRLFAAENPVLTLNRVCSMEIPSIRATAPELPAALDAIVRRALARPLDERYASAREMADDLDRVLDVDPADATALAGYLEKHDWGDGTEPSRRVVRAPSPRKKTSSETPPEFADSEEVKDLVAQLRRDRDLWHLVSIGDLLRERGDKAVACSAYRTAAALFAQRGLLVQAVCAAQALKDLLAPELFEHELETLATLRGASAPQIGDYFTQLDGAHGLWLLVQSLGSSDLDEDTSILHPAPLFGSLTPADFARLVSKGTLHRVQVGTVFLKEGEVGSSLFALGRGRMVVRSTRLVDDTSRHLTTVGLMSTDNDQVYVSALGEGDFFGEFSFLTGQPRSASVEAISDCYVLELGHRTTDDILRKDTAYQQPLFEFYKERVGERLMAVNPVFSLLSTEDRQALLNQSVARRYEDQEHIVRVGEPADELYFIKYGEVEVYRDEDGLPIFINKLREGEFFGEGAVIRRTPRSANVRAMGTVELLYINREDLDRIFEREPKLAELMSSAIEMRTEEAEARMRQALDIFSAT